MTIRRGRNMGTKKKISGKAMGYLILIGLVIASWAIFKILSPHNFGSFSNMLNYFQASLIATVGAVGFYFVMVMGMFDFSIGANIMLSAIVGCVFAIIIVKQLFGGLGQNFMNPALAARCFLLIAFTGPMTNFVTDTFSGATPLAVLKPGAEPGTATSLLTMFIGKHAGVIGETSVVCLLIGAIYLLVRKVISLRIPASYILTFAVLIFLFAPGHQFDAEYMLKELCGGGLMLGAFFMATDYVTSPITPNGKIVFGVILGLLTFIFRMFGGSAEGVSYAIIFSNLLVPLIEKVTVPKSFGKKKPVKEAK